MKVGQQAMFSYRDTDEGHALREALGVQWGTNGSETIRRALRELAQQLHVCPVSTTGAQQEAQHEQQRAAA